MVARWLGWTLSVTLGLGLPVGAWAVVGVSLNAMGDPLVYHDQVLECPNKAGDGRYQVSYANGQRGVRGSCSSGLAVGS